MPTKKKAPPAFPAGGDPLAVAPSAIANAAASLAGFTPTVAPYDEKDAEKAADALRPRLAAIAPERVVTPRLDVDAAARALLTVHAFVVQAPQVYGWFSTIHKGGLFDIANVDELRSVASVVIYAYREAQSAGAFKATAKIPEALDQASAKLEREMQSVCEHNFGDDPELGPVLDLLRPGTSYLDRADDLLAYAKMYDAQPMVVSKDTKYKSTHAADARKLAGEIIAALGSVMSPTAREEYDLLQRAWTLLSKMYVEVQATGLYLLRHDPQAAQRFPSVFAVGRPGVGRKPSKKAASPGADAPADEPVKKP